ncbi:MAG: hypothetical protein A3C90_00465 [Candidatus Magasanikbacteria bacterium RIFCSPHIGHO2_02_FULL_51_14]|uniref:Acylphosphatase n=1 Tax=Candidatus Magasanikbacteria bacterium RIFCSPHIGHO2_02_FULL_51_14 TaxID=1798683 RepID=A0A1F6MHG6_9BACT|nr:MAG: hypothetical protein A3C90_00465 [Candidatus Magasanikbacteria bacterium RIFCSPHIGHO2_02_FULL_51_14]
MKRITLVITGLVQGVNFRWRAQEEAEKLGLAGYVRNMPDGTVELVAEGAEDQLNALKEWCCRGPRHANVDRCEEKWVRIDEKSFDSFDIRY